MLCQAKKQRCVESVAEIVQCNAGVPSSFPAIDRKRGPVAAIKAAAASLDGSIERKAYVEELRIQAVLDSARASHPRIMSGLRAWSAFVDQVLGTPGRHLPPTVDGLVAFSAFFRSVGTYSNYISSIAYACCVLNVPDDACRHRMVKRAKAAVKSREGPPRVKRRIQRPLLAKLIDLALREGDQGEAALYALCYAFLLRCASEAFPIVFCVGQRTDRAGIGAGASVLQLEEFHARLHLARRKNAPGGRTLDRDCWCTSCPRTCPVHSVLSWARSLPCGSTPFADFRAHDVRINLRRRLAKLGVVSFEEYGLHAFRRGHAEDMAESGAPLFKILNAGDWHSAAFAAYLNMQNLEKRVVKEVSPRRFPFLCWPCYSCWFARGCRKSAADR